MIHALDAAANASEDVPRDRGSALRNFRSENLVFSLLAEENGLITDRRVRNLGDIDNCEIHRDSAQHRTAHAVDQHRRTAIRERARVTVGEPIARVAVRIGLRAVNVRP